MSPQIGPAFPESVNRRSLKTGQDGSARLKVTQHEAFFRSIDEPRHDSGPHAELLDREDLADGQTGDPVTEGDPCTEIRRVARRSLIDQDLNLGGRDPHEEIAVDHRQLRRQSAAVQVPHGDA